MPFFNDILSDLKSDGHIISSDRYQLNSRFSHFIKDMYSIDTISDWKIEYKFRHSLLSASSTEIGVIQFDIGAPHFRNREDGVPISRVIEKIKSKIRNRYRPKISHYVSDIIIHINDNYEHTKNLSHILTTYEEFRNK